MSRGSPRDKPLLIYDDSCGFCRRSVEFLRRRVGDAIETAPLSTAAGEIPRGSLEQAVHLRETDGSVSSGAEAVFRVLTRMKCGGLGLVLYRRMPGFSALSEAVYRLVARHRPRS